MTAMDWVLFVVSVAAFIMSSATWITKLIHDDLKISITPVAILSARDLVMLQVTIENKSRRPVSVTNIVFDTSRGLVPCAQISQRYLTNTHRTGGEITYQHHEMSLGLPVYLGDCGAVSGVLLFFDDAQILEPGAKEQTVRVSTTRGALIETISLDVPPLKIGSL